MTRDVSAAALVLAPFAVALAVVHLASPPGPDQLAAADPLVRTIQAWLGPWAIPLLALAVAVFYAVRFRPDRPALRKALALAGAGAAAAALLLFATRLIFGASLPGFIPPEEGAKPGLALGLAAAVVEESLFRLLALPALVWAAGGSPKRAWIPILATGLLFALSHEVGPGAGAFEIRHFVTRALVPGCLMSALFFRPGPAFIVSAHATAHLLLPWLFR